MAPYERTPAFSAHHCWKGSLAFRDPLGRAYPVAPPTGGATLRRTRIVGARRYCSHMSSIELVADADAHADADADTSVSRAAAAALGDLTRAVDVLQQHSFDRRRDEDLLGVFQQLEKQRRRLATVDHRLITELKCRSTTMKFLALGTAGLLTDLLRVDTTEAKARVQAAAPGRRRVLRAGPARTGTPRPVRPRPGLHPPGLRHSSAMV